MRIYVLLLFEKVYRKINGIAIYLYMQLIHDFRKSLLTSEQTTVPDSLYFMCFAQGIKIEVCARDTIEQVQDRIDKVITLPSGKVIKVEEKLRYKDYGDLLVEEFSCVETQSQGWITKPSKADYLVYYIIPTKTARIYRMSELQNEWSKHNEDIKIYGEKRIAKSSDSYHTLNWSISYKYIKSRCFVVTV
jgi:hypothetical protein